MSLHTLAQQLQSAGRGDDKILVHMTPAEVGGLQSLAMAHGGSLSINPETGLPEAGFLKSILPTIAGIGLSMIPGVGPLMAAGIVGGGTALATGSLEKGLMAGLGAYGGAGLGAGLSSMGTAAGAAGAAGTAGPATSFGMANEAAKQGLFATPTMPANAALNATNNAVLNSPMMTGQLGYGGFNAANFMGAPATSPAMATVPSAASVPSVVQSTPIYSGTGVATPPQTQFDKIAAGAKRATSGIEGMKELYGAMPKYSVTAGLGSLMAGAMQRPDLEIQKQKSLIRPYDFAYNPTDVAAEPYTGSAERLHFAPVFTARTPYEAPGLEYKASGGITQAYAVGGPVEQMAALNSVGANTGYPMASIDTPLYSNPMIQRPEATNVLAPSADVGVGTYTGEPRFAEGGYTYSYDPKTMQFTQTSAPKAKSASGLGGMLSLPGMGNPSTPNNNAFVAMALAGPGMSNYRPVAKAEPTAPAAPIVTGGIAPPAFTPAPQQAQPAYEVPAYRSPEEQLGLGKFYDYMNQQLAAMGGYQGYAEGGGISNLGDYSDGGRLLKGPGNGTSDSIPAIIGEKQPARLAEGEFVIPARIVSEIGNGSTDAGAKQLYAMMDRVQKARRKTVGKGKVAVDAKARNELPA